MNQAKYSAISHRDLSICNPLSEAKIEQAIQLLAMRPTERAIDFGAGKGEFLIRLIERYGASATAVELENSQISELPGLLQKRISPEKVSVVLKDAKRYIVEDLGSPYDVGICVGSTHALGGYGKTLDALQQAVKPKGLLLIGDLYWKKSPSPEFLEFLGGNETDQGTHEGNILEAEKRGLVPLWSCVTSEDDFDTYEWRTSKAIEDYVNEHPDDPDREDLLERVQHWRHATLKWGRDTWGFGLYLFRNGR